MNSFAALLVRVRRRTAFVLPLVALVLLGLLGLLGLVGRREMHRHATDENARMATVFRAATVHGLRSRALHGYRLASKFDCLVYSAQAGPYALELCFDPEGRLVETLDRRGAQPRIASLREQPSLATLRVPIRRLLAAFVVAGAFRDSRLAGVTVHRNALPVGVADGGVTTR